jgi:hypothetical protein
MPTSVIQIKRFSNYFNALVQAMAGRSVRLIDAGKYYFLSRPRRFGKSLFLDTLAELFAGSEALFTGLEAHARWDWSRRFPEVQLSFGAGVVQSRAELERRIRAPLARNASTLGLACSDADDIAGCFAELIEQAHERHGAPVVVLVDEYDKPILDNLTRPEAARDIRDGLRNLSVIKDSDAHIRFAFLTGVSKFSKGQPVLKRQVGLLEAGQGRARLLQERMPGCVRAPVRLQLRRHRMGDVVGLDAARRLLAEQRNALAQVAAHGRRRSAPARPCARSPVPAPPPPAPPYCSPSPPRPAPSCRYGRANTRSRETDWRGCRAPPDTSARPGPPYGR